MLENTIIYSIHGSKTLKLYLAKHQTQVRAAFQHWMGKKTHDLKKWNVLFHFIITELEKRL